MAAEFAERDSVTLVPNAGWDPRILVCRCAPTVDAFIYHRHVDHAKEGGLRLGLWRNAPHSIADPHSKKLIYELFKKAGTPEWREAADTLLPVTGLKAWNE